MKAQGVMEAEELVVGARLHRIWNCQHSQCDGERPICCCRNTVELTTTVTAYNNWAASVYYYRHLYVHKHWLDLTSSLEQSGTIARQKHCLFRLDCYTVVSWAS